MTGITTTFNPVNDGIILVLFIVGIIASARTRIPRQTIKDLESLVKAQGEKIRILEEGRITDTKTIGTLEGQVKTYKELPLIDLANGIKEVSQTNKQILETLQATAKINAEDRDVLTNQNLHIKTEVHREMDKAID